MIYGLGTDITNTDRIGKALAQKGRAFLERCYTNFEIDRFDSFSSQDRAHKYLATRFAAKEAFAKALGTGIGAAVSFKDVEVYNTERGKPEIKISEKTKEYLQEAVGHDKNFSVHLSISDNEKFAQAVVIIEVI